MDGVYEILRIVILTVSLMAAQLPRAPAAEFQAVFKAEAIPDDVRGRITGVSWKEGCPVPIGDLRLVTVTYAGFDGDSRTGELIMHKNAADEIVGIFKELYDARFPIERIELVDSYGADDSLSMAANNTSAFCYRTVSGSQSLSKHAYGYAIDINPVQNPYVYGSYVSPEAGREYTDRSDVRPGMIVEGDAAHRAFASRGWTWGGDWRNTIDYQHFQKSDW
jgi:hypothetical protein